MVPTEATVWYVSPSMVHGSAESHQWVKTHVRLPRGQLGAHPYPFPVSIIPCDAGHRMDTLFRFFWGACKAKGYELWADVPWPVEANFLTRCFVRCESEYSGPYPLLDVETFCRAKGTDDSLALSPSLRVHNPLDDCLHSLHRLRHALGLSFVDFGPSQDKT
jgi:hypothetical protein